MWMDYFQLNQEKRAMSSIQQTCQRKLELNESYYRALTQTESLPPARGATTSSFRGGGFMQFHSMPSSCLFNHGTTFSQTVAYNNNAFLPADTKSILQTHTFCTTLVNKNRRNNVLQQRWRLNHRCQAKFLTSRHMRMHRETFNISNTLRKLIIRA